MTHQLSSCTNDGSVSHIPPQWGARHPTRNRLRAEAHSLAECVRDQLLALIPDDEIRGIYLTGSTVKPWDSLLDYVPEISDVDIHVSFRDDCTWRQHLDSVPRALEVQAAIETCFDKRCPQSRHRPRPQLLVLNKLMAEREGFVYSPQSTVVVLHGEPYPKDDYGDPDTIRRHNAADLVERAAYAERVPLLAIDRPWTYSRDLLSQLSWRISPVGPLVLHLSGIGTEHVWTLNRTRVTAALHDLALHDLADAYAAFYQSGWNFFLSRFTDTTASRAAILAGTGVLAEGADFGQQWLAENPVTRNPTPSHR